jgi:hypothetical protein
VREVACHIVFEEDDSHAVSEPSSRVSLVDSGSVNAWNCTPNEDWLVQRTIARGTNMEGLCRGLSWSSIMVSGERDGALGLASRQPPTDKSSTIPSSPRSRAEEKNP